MPRIFYTYAIFFTALNVFVALVRAYVYFLIDTRIGEVQSFPQWIGLEIAALFIGSLFLLKYYEYKNYRPLYWMLLALSITQLWQFWFFYNLMTTKEVTAAYLSTTFIVMIINTIYSTTLIFSRSRNRKWLRRAGIFTLTVQLLVFVSLVVRMMPTGAGQSGLMATIDQSASLLYNVSPFFFILNFVEERKEEKYLGSLWKAWKEITFCVAVITVLGVLFFSQRIIGQSLWIIRHPSYVPKAIEQVAEPFQAYTLYTESGNSIQYRLMLPIAYDSMKVYPLVICLHGSSGCGSDNIKQIAAAFPALMLSSEENRKKYPAFVFVPQCPLKSSWGGVSGVRAVDSLVFLAMNAIEEKFSIDRKRIYVTGVSLGGYGTWHFIELHPELFAAAIPISGGGNPRLAKNILNVPIWAFHGAKDLNVPVSRSREMIKAIRNAGGEPLYTEFPDEAHDISKNVREMPEILDWLFLQHK